MKKQMLCWLSGLMMLAGISLMVDAVATYVIAQEPGTQPTSPGCDNLGASISKGDCPVQLKLCEHQSQFDCTTGSALYLPDGTGWPLAIAPKTGYNAGTVWCYCYYDTICQWRELGTPNCIEWAGASVYIRQKLTSILCPQ